MFGDVARVAACLRARSLTACRPRRGGRHDPRNIAPISSAISAAPRASSVTSRVLWPDLGSAAIGAAGLPRKARSATASYRQNKGPQRASSFDRLQLEGMLAQIAREGLVRDLAGRLTADFARNRTATFGHPAGWTSG